MVCASVQLIARLVGWLVGLVSVLGLLWLLWLSWAGLFGVGLPPGVFGLVWWNQSLVAWVRASVDGRVFLRVLVWVGGWLTCWLGWLQAGFAV